MKKHVWSSVFVALLLALACICSACNGNEEKSKGGGEQTPPASQGLTFELNEDGESYTLTNVGSCTDVDIVIPAKYRGKPVTAIGRDCFNYCAFVRSVVIPEGVTEIDGGFYGCVNLESVTIPNSVTSVGNAFSECPKLAFGEDDRGYYLGNQKNPYLVFLRLKDDSIADACEIRQGTRVLAKQAFAYSSVTSIKIPATVTHVGAFAFDHAWYLVTVYAEDPIAWLNITFDGSSRIDLLRAEIRFVNQVGNEITEVVIPEGTERIEDYAFAGCTGLTSVTIPDSVTSIGDGVFWDCDNLVGYEYENGYYLGNDNNPYLIFWQTRSEEISSLKIHEDTRFISDYAFASCAAALESVTIPHGVVSLGRRSFSSCASLTSIEIPNTVTKIGYGAFYNCSGLSSVTIPDSVTDIDDYAFEGCVGLVSVELGKGMTAIPQGMFDGCVSLSEIPIPENVTKIGNWAFSGCAGLTSISIHAGITDIGIYAFENCTGLTNITLPDEIERMPNSVFQGCTNLKSITLPSGLKKINSHAFANCTGLTSIVLPDGLERIYGSAFDGCVNLESIVMPRSIVSIQWYSFDDCTSIQAVYYGGTAQEWRKIVSEASPHNPNLTEAPCYYYSETEPVEEGNYWRYVNGVPTPYSGKE